MKVIFLDLDGVLMTWDEAMIFVEINGERFQIFKPQAVKNLNRIINETKAKIVISSTWRSTSRIPHENLLQHFREQGVTGEVIGITPRLGECVNGIWNAKVRGDEIQAWLDENPTDAFVILDDESDMAHLIDRLVQVKDGMATGLTKEQADIAINMMR